jgi:hypothetical protein
MTHLAENIIELTARGPSDIDAVFGLAVPFKLVFVKAHFTGGTGTADFTISKDSREGSSWDIAEWVLKAKGVGVDVNFYVPDDEREGGLFGAEDNVKISWTNPDTGNTLWGLSVGLRDASL